MGVYKDWDNLQLIGKRRRLNKVYDLLDVETPNYIFFKYNYLDDNQYTVSDLDELRWDILKENRQSGFYNSRIYNQDIVDLLA